MMPPPEEVAVLVDRAECIEQSWDGMLMHKTREERRRLLAWAAFEYLRRQLQDVEVPEPVSV